MKRRVMAGINRLLSWLIALLLLMGVAAAPVYAADETTTTTTTILPLVPEDLVYENGNVILHKHGERIGPTEWKVTVRATIGEEPIEKRKMEVVFLLDISSSMRTNTAHDHTAECNDEVCGLTEHTHNSNCTKVSTCELKEHTHSEECCSKEEHTHSLSEDCCGIEAHTHSIENGCYAQCTNHWSDWQHTNAGCTQYGWRWYTSTLICGENVHEHSQDCINECTKEEHSHSDACVQYYNCGVTVEHTHVEGECYTYSCGYREHAHTLGCYKCPYYGSKPGRFPTWNGGTQNDDDYLHNDDATRMAVAVVAAERLIASLPKEVTTVTRLAFATKFYDDITSYYDLYTHSGTYMWTAINETLDGGYFSKNDTQKVFVILTDGEANDDNLNAQKKAAEGKLDTFMNPNGTDGAVFTVGFAYDDSDLAAIAGNGGKYLYASDADSLEFAFAEIERELTAMLIDPMGTTVGFDKNSILGASTTSGVISWSDDTIYWNPSEDGEGTVNNSTIEYSYTVELNDQADVYVGEHYNVPLNKPTDFLYGIKNPTNNTITDMKEAAFPIPHAVYEYSSVQTNWRVKGTTTDIKTPLPTEKIVSDYSSATYTPTFTQDYKTITPVIPKNDNSGNYYRYVDTTVVAYKVAYDANGNVIKDSAGNVQYVEVAGITDVDAIDSTKPYKYVVVHNYELVEAEKLILGGTKTLIGRDFMTGDTFTFTLNAVTNGAPMPKGTGNVVTITPTSGTSATFEFGEIDFTGKATGEYKYTIQETQGSLEGVVYDTKARNLTVNINNGKVTSYVLDGVQNAPLLITNRLTPGNLKVEKTEVTSNNEAHQTQAFPFDIQVNDMSGRPMTGTYTVKKSDDTTSTITFDAGYAAVTLKVGESIEIFGLPMGATYTVTEYAPPGFTATAKGDKGTIVANDTVTASFTNAYSAEGRYQFRAMKVLKDASGKTLDLAQGQFTFQVLDADGNVKADGTNNADGSVFLDTMTFTEMDIGTKTYRIVEVAGDDASILYGGTVYNVTLTITDNGDGTLTITDDLGTNEIITFTNTKISNQFVVSKTVAGDLGSRNREFTFTVNMPDMANKEVNVSYDGGATFTSTRLDANGQANFTLKHGERIIFYPVTGSYTVTETDYGSYDVAYSVNQGDQTEEDTASGTVEENGTHVAFVNTLEATVPTGIHTPATSALIGICLAVGLIAIALAGRREVFYES